VTAVARLGQLDRGVCHQEATSRFGAARMIDDYAALFTRILDANTTGIGMEANPSDLRTCSPTPKWTRQDPEVDL